jgi:hypothetical protein
VPGPLPAGVPVEGASLVCGCSGSEDGWGSGSGWVGAAPGWH